MRFSSFFISTWTGRSLTLLMALYLPLSAASTADSLPSPNMDYSAEEVVSIVIEALAQNGQSEDDAGIATVYRFAAPENKAVTGPLPRFTRMIKQGFSDMLDHDNSRFDPIEIKGDKAVQAVWLTTPSGQEIGYGFQLGRQKSGEYEGMWMTESVVPLGQGERSGTRI